MKRMKRMKRIILIIAMLVGVLNVQTQTIDLSKSHNWYRDPVYVLDFMEIDSTLYYSIGLTVKDIKKIKTKDDTIFVSTKLAIDFNGKLLEKNKDKQVSLSKIYKSNIKSIVKIGQQDALEKYGEIGKKG